MRIHLRSVMTLSQRSACLIVLAMLFDTSAAAAPLQLLPHSATYKIKINVLGGELKTQLVATDDGYVATHEVTPTGMSRMLSRGSIRESSEFHATSDGIRATRYLSTDTLSREHSDVAIEFDWDASEASGTVDGEEFSLAMQALSHDRISIQYQLMYDLLNGVRDAEYTMFEIDRLRAVTVRNIGSRIIKVPAGEFVATGIQHQAEGSKRATTLWCVEELGYLPVVIEQHRLGALKFRATLVKYQPGDWVRSER